MQYPPKTLFVKNFEALHKKVEYVNLRHLQKVGKGHYVCGAPGLQHLLKHHYSSSSIGTATVTLCIGWVSFAR